MAWLQVNFFSNCLMRSVPLNILIPAERALQNSENSFKPYKTLYLLHGYHGNCSEWLLNGDVQAVSNDYNLAIVMPSGNNDFYVDAPNGSKDMSRFISEELIDFTRRLLPLSHLREDTILGGLSMGAFGTLYNCFTYSDVFGHGIALSAPLILQKEHLDDLPDEPDFMGVCKGYYYEVFSEDIASLPESPLNPHVAARHLAKSGKPVPNMYIACGYNDMLKHDNRLLCKTLDEVGISYFYEEGPGSHEWAFWKPYLRRGIEHVLQCRPIEFKNPFYVEASEEERRNG